MTSENSPIRNSPQLGSDQYQAAVRFLYDRINYERMSGSSKGYRFRLQRISQLLRQLDLADYLYADTRTPKVPLVHIAGTKGKGSTAAMVAAVLSQAGCRTGLYTSPHLHSLEERFKVDGRACAEDDLVWLVDHIRDAAAAVEQSLGAPSFFELTTALAFLHFHRQKCDAIVMEVGLGGRLDSTNVCSPSVTAVTSIGLDHQHVLGDDLATIAAEKAGIIKSGVPVVSGVTDSSPAGVIDETAARQQAPLFQIGRDFQIESTPSEVWGSSLHYSGGAPPLSPQLRATLAMEGQHQAGNAGVAIAIIDLLREQGMSIPKDAVVDGLAELQCNSRIERFVLAKGVTAIVDAAHNEDSIDALCDCLRRRCHGGKVCVVFGTSVDKPAAPMLQSLGEVADQLILTRFLGNPRFQPPDQLLPLVPDAVAARPVVMEDPIKACAAGLEMVTPGGTLVICGSFFLAAETRKWIAERAA